MDEAKRLIAEMEVLKNRAEERDYVYRDYRVQVTSKKENDIWTVSGKLVLIVSEELDNPEAEKEIPFEVLVTDEDYAEALSQAFFNLNFIPQNFKDAIFEEEFFELLNAAQNVVDEDSETEEEVLM